MSEQPDSVDRHVGSKLRQLRFARKCTQNALADYIGVSFQQIQKYERGTNRLSASKMWLCAKFLGVDPGYFFEGLPDDFNRTPVDEQMTDWLASERGLQWAHVGLCLPRSIMLAMLDMARTVVTEAAA